MGNLGDEALKEYFLKSFPEVEWVVVSAKPQRGEYPRLPAGIRSLIRPWWKTLWVLKKSDGIVFGGGSLFTDVESSFACILWWWHAFIARFFFKPIYLVFQGVGPFETKVGEWCARWVVARARFISVRDANSYDCVSSWKKNTKVVRTIDPVISLIQAEKTMAEQKNVIIAIPRKNSGSAFKKSFEEVTKSKQWDEVRILSLQPDDGSEKSVCESLKGASQTPAEVVPIKSLKELSKEVSNGSFVLTQRYHGALAAVALCKDFEVVSQGEGDKLASLQEILSDGVHKEDLIHLVKVGEDALKGAIVQQV